VQIRGDEGGHGAFTSLEVGTVGLTGVAGRRTVEGQAVGGADGGVGGHCLGAPRQRGRLPGRRCVPARPVLRGRFVILGTLVGTAVTTSSGQVAR
jgi:hypothetical protein